MDKKMLVVHPTGVYRSISNNGLVCLTGRFSRRKTAKPPVMTANQNGPGTARQRCPRPNLDEGYFAMADSIYKPVLPHINGPRGQIITERFWSKVAIAGPNDCWEWQASKSKHGYGRFKITSLNMVHSNRVALAIGAGVEHLHLQSLHSCDNPGCCNPSHLRWGTHDDNMRDMAERGRHRAVDQKGAANGAAKLTEADVSDIIRMFRDGYSNVAISRIKPIGHAMVSKIRVGCMWRETAAKLGWEPAIQEYAPNYKHRHDLAPSTQGTPA